MTLRIALLDDYQQLAMGMADWASLPEGTVVHAFNKAITGEDELVNALRTSMSWSRCVSERRFPHR